MRALNRKRSFKAQISPKGPNPKLKHYPQIWFSIPWASVLQPGKPDVIRRAAAHRPARCTGFAGAKRITLVMDNLSTHCGASLYKAFGELSRAAFEPEVARRLLDRLEFVYTPKHGSWLNMSECEFSVLLRQCLNRRLPDIDRVRSEVNAWVEVRNGVGNTANWRFTTEDARIKLRSLYPAKLN